MNAPSSAPGSPGLLGVYQPTVVLAVAPLGSGTSNEHEESAIALIIAVIILIFISFIFPVTRDAFRIPVSFSSFCSSFSFLQELPIRATSPLVRQIIRVHGMLPPNQRIPAFEPSRPL